MRSLTDYGAFVDIGGVDALLHVADISWGRVNKPADVLTVGQQMEAKVLKVDAAKRRISLGMKQLQPHPWELASEKYKVGDRVQGTVTRVADFGAFVELEKGVEGLIHLSEMSWSKKVRKPSDVVSRASRWTWSILGVNQADRRISLGLEAGAGRSLGRGRRRNSRSARWWKAPVTSLQKFGAFVQLAEGVEGMIHVGDISAEKRINHPQDVLKMGQMVKAQVLEVDTEKRRLRLGMKQLVPTSLDEYIAEHKEGDVVTGRMTDVSGGRARVELGEGVQATCRMSAEAPEAEERRPDPTADLSSLSSMLASQVEGRPGRRRKREAARAGQIRSFRIVKLDAGRQENRTGTGVTARTGSRDRGIARISGAATADRKLRS